MKAVQSLKRRQEEQLAKDIAKFKARGGRIEKLAPVPKPEYVPWVYRQVKGYNTLAEAIER